MSYSKNILRPLPNAYSVILNPTEGGVKNLVSEAEYEKTDPSPARGGIRMTF
jgi:hypothetical protein